MPKFREGHCDQDMSFWHPCQNRCISVTIDEIQPSDIYGTSSTFHI